MQVVVADMPASDRFNLKPAVMVQNEYVMVVADRVTSVTALPACTLAAMCLGY